MSTDDDHISDAALHACDELPENTESSASKQRGVYGWMISGGVHVSVLALAWLVVGMAPRVLEMDPPVTRVTPIETPPKAPEKPKPVRALEEKPQIDDPVEVDNPVKTNLEETAVVSESESENASEQPQGRPEATATSEDGGPGAFIAIGTGGPGAGMLGLRTGGGLKRAVGRNGGSPGSEAAVENSLRWFKRHQSPNGSWETDRYYQNCTEGAKCEPGGDPKGHGSDCNVAMTGYALLCFLGHGYDHRGANKYRTTVKKGLDWLLAEQKADGYFGNRNYEHAVGVMALAEAYAMTGDPELRGPAQKGVDQILAHQNQDDANAKKGADAAYAGGLGWDYTKPTMRNDSSVTGWNVMALKSAMAGNLNVGSGFDGSKRWVERAWKGANEVQDGAFKPWKEITAYDQSKFGYCWFTDKGNEAANGRGRESIGLVCSVFLGHLSGDPMAESLANTIMATQMPKSFNTNIYYMYYNTMAIFQMGGDRWLKWNAEVRDTLVNAQRRSTDCLDGSWDYDQAQFAGHELGRVLTTAYCTLSLEVYYRYDQIARLHKAK